ncbi:DUF1090 domain-containing protein [Kluyvera sp. STS39-E]|uniref:DUF1090 domain-containing protein n=1 Tax=Kluyvera sp. STS39-E TaxID=3234748 RepID=UPI0034C65B5B
MGLSKKMAVSLLLCAPLVLTVTQVHAEGALTGCAAKKQNIDKQIDYANAHGNHHRVAGLEKARDEVSRNCTDGKLRSERNEKVREKEQKVKERESDLNLARETGSQEKIAKKAKKLKEAQDELAEAKSNVGM